ncbi:hypothetical protein [Nocardia fusca]|uniref:hypothetical protein n=1 Tax=Nocardia fusca TaxID=941183 RepID=UPI0007A73B28|nr:hypothetical protein [Nocardia fusca]
MLRRLVASCLLLGCLTACGTGTGDDRNIDDFWLAESATDADRLELLRRARQIDPCALLPRDKLADYGTVLRVFNNAPSSCTATLNSDELSERTQFRVSFLVRDPGVPSHEPGVPTRMVDGVEVTTVRELDQLGEDYEDQLLERSCAVTAGFGSQLLLQIQNSNPVGTEPCPAGEQMMAAALEAWKDEPPLGSSPDTARTVIDGVDPCAPAAALGVAVPADRQSMWSCEFDYRGDQISLDYGYLAEKQTAGPPTFTVGAHEAYRVDEPGDDFVHYWGRIGPPIENADKVSYMGPALPTITVMGKDPATVEDVVRRAFSLTPAP